MEPFEIYLTISILSILYTIVAGLYAVITHHEKCYKGEAISPAQAAVLGAIWPLILLFQPFKIIYDKLGRDV